MKKMKELLAVVLTLAMLCGVFAYAEEVNTTEDVLGAEPVFTWVTVTEDDMNAILEAGYAEADTLGGQVEFVSVTTPDMIRKIIGMPEGEFNPENEEFSFDEGEKPEFAIPDENGEMPENGEMSKNGPVGFAAAIVVFADEDAEAGMDSVYESIIEAANILGYEVQTTAEALDAINGEEHDALCEEWGIDVSMKANNVFLINMSAAEETEM